MSPEFIFLLLDYKHCQLTVVVVLSHFYAFSDLHLTVDSRQHLTLSFDVKFCSVYDQFFF